MQKKKTFKKEKLEALILLEINQFLKAQAKDPRFNLVAFTKVELNNDFSSARVYWDCFNKEHREEIERIISPFAGTLRTYLSKILPLRIVPHIQMFYDSQYDDELKIEQLIQANL